MAINHESRGTCVGDLESKRYLKSGHILNTMRNTINYFEILIWIRKWSKALLKFYLKHLWVYLFTDNHCICIFTWQRKVVQSGMARPKYSNIITICHRLMFKYFSKISNHRISVYISYNVELMMWNMWRLCILYLVRNIMLWCHVKQRWWSFDGFPLQSISLQLLRSFINKIGRFLTSN